MLTVLHKIFNSSLQNIEGIFIILARTPYTGDECNLSKTNQMGKIKDRKQQTSENILVRYH